MSPVSDTPFRPGEEIPFYARILEVGGDTIPEEGIVWASDVDGRLGTGSSLRKVLTGSPNGFVEHTVTVTATALSGRTATDRVRVRVGLIP